MKIKRKLFTLISAIGFVILTLGLYAFTADSKVYESYAPKHSWKNLKVLPQDISKDSLNYLMKNYSLSLGVNCNHCHALRKDDASKLDFASDDKIEKEIARVMIEMTNNLNETVFKPHYPDPKPNQVEVINCVMCHRGTVNPEKHLSQMKDMYKTYDPNRDNRKEKAQEEMKKEKKK